MLRTAEVFTIAIPTVSYVARAQIEKDIKRELERRDRVICLTGPSKSGKTVLVKKIISDCPIIHGQVGVSATDIWRQLCSIQNIPLNFREGERASVEGKAVVAKAEYETDRESQIISDPRQAFLAFVRKKKIIVFDDFHYFEQEAQQAILQGLRQLLQEKITIIIILTSYGEDQPILAESDILARIKFLKLPEWDDHDLGEILRKGFRALNISVSETDIGNLVKRSFGNPLVIQELGSFLCFSNDITETCPNELLLSVGNADAFLREAVSKGELQGDKPTFMQLIIGRTPPRERTEYQTKSGGKGDVYYLVFNALRAFDLAAPVPYEALNKMIRDSVAGEQKPQGGQITTALDELKKTNRDLVKKAQDNHRSRELPVEWRPDIRTVYISDPFLKLYVKWANWDEDYKERLGQLKRIGRSHSE
jgi:hypothetical protein